MSTFFSLFNLYAVFFDIRSCFLSESRVLRKDGKDGKMYDGALTQNKVERRVGDKRRLEIPISPPLDKSVLSSMKKNWHILFVKAQMIFFLSFSFCDFLNI